MHQHSRRWALLMAAGLTAALLIAAVPTAAQGDPTPTPFYDINDDPVLNAQMDHVEAAASILRDLEPLESVTRAFIDREALLAYLTAELDESYPPEAARDDVIFYHAFGFMPLETDLRQVQLDVLHEQVGGFYDTELEAMFVISEDDDLDALNQVLYAHEFTHVLQDQYYDLDALGLVEDTATDSPDVLLALQGLVEGDAMLMTEGYQSWLMQSDPGTVFDMLGEALLINTAALQAAPPILRYELMFPYTAGREFAYTLFVAGDGWDMINAAYAAPPRSTEQILHPERYVAGDAPQPVTVAALHSALGEDWRAVWQRTLGEFYLREHLRVFIPTETAAEAAAGWGGDQYRVYFNEATGQTVLALRIAWDTPEDAAEFAAAYRGYGALRYDHPGVETDPTLTCWFAAETLCVRAGAQETLIFQLPDRAMIADVLPLFAPVEF